MRSTERRRAATRASAPSGLRLKSAQEGEVGAIGSADVFRKKKKSAINGPWAPTTGGWFAVAYGPFRRLCGTSPDAQRLMMIPGRIPRFATLFKEDATLGEGEEWVKELQYKRLEGGQGESRALENLLSVVGDDFLRNGVAIRSLQAYGQRLRAGDRGSERRRRPSLHRPPRGCPHRRDRRPSAPRLAAEIGFWLKQHFPHVQFVVTTHSPLVCPAADGGRIYHLPQPGRGEPFRLSDDDYREVIAGKPDEILLTPAFGMNHTRSPKAVRARERHALLIRCGRVQSAIAGRRSNSRRRSGSRSSLIPRGRTLGRSSCSMSEPACSPHASSRKDWTRSVMPRSPSSCLSTTRRWSSAGYERSGV